MCPLPTKICPKAHVCASVNELMSHSPTAVSTVDSHPFQSNNFGHILQLDELETSFPLSALLMHCISRGRTQELAAAHAEHSTDDRLRIGEFRYPRPGSPMNSGERSMRQTFMSLLFHLLGARSSSWLSAPYSLASPRTVRLFIILFSLNLLHGPQLLPEPSPSLRC